MTARKPLVIVAGQTRQIAAGDILDAPAITANGIPLATVDHSHTGLVGFDVSFPGSPATNQVFFRQDLGVLCNWDGTRWLGPHEPAPLSLWFAAPPFVATQTSHICPIWPSTIVITELRTVHQVITTNNATNYWTIALYIDNTLITSINTISSGVAATVATNNAISMGAYSPSVYMRIVVTKTGSPGSLYMVPSVRIRRVYT